MTLDTLNDHLHTLWEYQAAQERLESLRAAVLGAQQMDGMPHSSGPSTYKIERLAIILAEQEDDVKRLGRLLRRSEKTIRSYVSGIRDNRTKLIFSLRFLGGQTWPDVAKTIGGGNTPETVKSACYRHLLREQSTEM